MSDQPDQSGPPDQPPQDPPAPPPGDSDAGGDDGDESGESPTIRVNFGRPMPLFPLVGVSLMPHAVLPVHVFEPRYRQMVDSALDGPGQIAMAVYDEDAPPDEHARRALRPAVCVGQIVQHQQLPDGRYNLALHGVCRAKIAAELPPGQGRLYRLAYLEPVGIEEHDPASVEGHRASLLELIERAPLSDLRVAPEIAKHLRDPEVPVSAVLELVTFTLLTDAHVRYELLAEGDTLRRAQRVERELGGLRRLLLRAIPQRRDDQPKGVSLN